MNEEICGDCTAKLEKFILYFQRKSLFPSLKVMIFFLTEEILLNDCLFKMPSFIFFYNRTVNSLPRAFLSQLSVSQQIVHNTKTSLSKFRVSLSIRMRIRISKILLKTQLFFTCVQNTQGQSFTIVRTSSTSSDGPGWKQGLTQYIKK